MKIRLYQIIMAMLFLGLAGVGAQASGLPMAKPEKVGFSTERLQRLTDYFKSEIEGGKLAGAVTLVSRYGKVVHFEAQGYADLATGKKMEKDSIFRLASMTKPITATALMMLYEEGKFQLSDPISKYLPELKDLQVYAGTNADGSVKTVPAERAPTMQDVLRHTAGFTAWWYDNPVAQMYRDVDITDYDAPASAVITKLAKIPLLYQPGTKWRYSHSNTVQGRLVEVISGAPLDMFFTKRLSGPMGLEDIAFWAPPEKHNRVPNIYNLGDDGKLHELKGPIVSDRYLRELALKNGDGGLVSSAADYWHFAQMMLNGGELDGKRFLGPETVALMTRDHIAPITDRGPTLSPGYGYGLGGSVLVDTIEAATPGPAGAYGWGGGYGPRFWIDRDNGIVAILMIQRREREYLPEMRSLVYSALIQ